MDVVAEVRRLVQEKLRGVDAELLVDADDADIYSVTVAPHGRGAPIIVYAEPDYVALTVAKDIRFEFEGRRRDLEMLAAAIDDVVRGGAVELFLGRSSAGGWLGAGRRSSSTLLTPVARLVGRRQHYGPYGVR